jgi:hypothetical protein
VTWYMKIIQINSLKISSNNLLGRKNIQYLITKIELTTTTTFLHFPHLIYNTCNYMLLFNWMKERRKKTWPCKAIQMAYWMNLTLERFPKLPWRFGGETFPTWDKVQQCTCFSGSNFQARQLPMQLNTSILSS